MIRALKFVFIGLCVIQGSLAWADINASEYTQTRIVEIFSLDYSKKTAVMSGYRYSFTGLKGYDLPRVQMLGTTVGAYGLLRPGMKAKVEYKLSKESRVVISLQQVALNTKLGIPEED